MAVLRTDHAPERWSTSDSLSDWPILRLDDTDPIILRFQEENSTRGRIRPSLRLLNAWTCPWRSETPLVINVLATVDRSECHYVSYTITLEASTAPSDGFQLRLQRKRTIGLEYGDSQPLGPTNAGYMVEQSWDPWDGSSWPCYSLSSPGHLTTRLDVPAVFQAVSNNPRTRSAWLDARTGAIIYDIKKGAIINFFD